MNLDAPVDAPVDALLNELYNGLIPGKPLESQANTFSDEESRMLKSHISGELTKYVNTLKYREQPVPFMYDYIQSVIGASTLIFYYCAAPAICDQLLELELKDFHYLLYDKIFRRRWIYNIRTRHSQNAFSSSTGTPSVSPNVSPYTEIEKTLQFRLEGRMDLSGTRFYTLLTEFTAAPYSVIPREALDILDPYFQEFRTRIDEIRTFLTEKSLNDCVVGNNVDFVHCMEDLRTIYMFYFKGGNSIRKIIESTNRVVADILQIDNTDEMIPYGSDFDTNVLINPYLSQDKFNNIKKIIELFIPIISQCIMIPTEFYSKLTKPPGDIFSGDANEQQLQMKILSQSYVLNAQYINYDRKREKAIAKFFDPRSRRSPYFFMDPQSLETPMEQTTVQTNGICRTKLNTGTQMFSTSTFPKLEHVATHNIRRHYPRNMQDVCFQSLQYSVNKSIPKFELYRYFLNFKLGERITKTNLKHRLLNVAGTFNAEMFDISIVMPVYVPDLDGAAVSCELLELWQHSDDIYKVLVLDRYKIVEQLKKNFQLLVQEGIYVLHLMYCLCLLTVLKFN